MYNAYHSHRPPPPPLSDNERFELGYPDPQQQAASVQQQDSLHLPGGYGVGGQSIGPGGYGVLPQGAYDEHDAYPGDREYASVGYAPGGGGGYGTANTRSLGAASQPPPSFNAPHYTSPPPSQVPLAPSISPFYTPYASTSTTPPPMRMLSPPGAAAAGAFEAAPASVNGQHPPPPSFVHASSLSYGSRAAPHLNVPPAAHPGQAYDPELYAGYDGRYDPSDRFGENRPARLRSRSPTPGPDNEDIDGALQQYSADIGETTFNDEKFPLDGSTLAGGDGEDEAAVDDPASLLDPDASGGGDTSQLHFGPAPEGRLLRRNKTRRKVRLTASGNLSIDAPVPTRLAALLPRKADKEKACTTYTAVTCDPDHFQENGFSLRQIALGRRTEIFIVITMYSEDEVLFLRTLYGVMKNISQLCQRSNSSWGPEGWKKVVVSIVADGRAHIHPKVLDVLTALGVYRDGLMKNTGPGGVPVQAHLFEYTTSFALDPEYNYDFGKSKGKQIVPCQILFCLKENNERKINSHRWFFNAFAATLEPNVCILLDVGTRPGPASIYKLWKVFDRSSNVGGACGEIATYKGPLWRKLLNPLVASQNFEYKMSNILDKPTESSFGYISVLPGAFSAYRYLALKNGSNGEGPLQKYFLGETHMNGVPGVSATAGVFERNMYLAEDRILCFELICNPTGSRPWVLRYVKDAVGETDVPEDFTEFILQRRRWLNGSFFASIYALAHTNRIWQSNHSTVRKIFLTFEAVYNAITLLFSWFAVANYYIFFVVLISSLEDPSFGIKNIAVLNIMCQYIYIGLVVACFLFSMGNRPKGSRYKYLTVIWGFGILTIYLVVATILCVIKASKNYGDPVYAQMVLSVLATYGVYFLSSCLALDPWHLITSFWQYIVLSPTYINVLSIYAFANLHDFSWGTKGEDVARPPSKDLGDVSGSGHEVDVELPADQGEIDAFYDEALSSIKQCKYPDKVATPSRKAAPSAKQRLEIEKDYYASFRTNVLLFWVMSNGTLAAAILSGSSASSFSDPGSKQAVYMVVVLGFVAATSIVRLLGSCMFLVVRLFTGN